MAGAEPAEPARSSRSSSEPSAFERAKRQLILACVTIAGGLAVAGSLDRTTGGVVLLVGWALAIASLHRLGRAGSDRR
jgi:hypothetical protein